VSQKDLDKIQSEPLWEDLGEIEALFEEYKQGDTTVLDIKIEEIEEYRKRIMIKRIKARNNYEKPS
jgi:hypothetical protein